jgi:hypothetical protein
MASTTNASSSRRHPLPAAVVDALCSMNWGLDHVPAMFYESLEKMAERRRQQRNDNLAIAHDIPGTIASLKHAIVESACTTSVQEDDAAAILDSCMCEHRARVATALLLLGNGYTDEAHDLVLSLSWRGELPYAYGPPVNVVNEQLMALACYTHCLVHRREGPHPSEFDMTGFQNSNYWAGHAMRILVGSDLLPIESIRDAVIEQAKQTGAAAVAQQWVQDNVDEIWDPRVLTELCAEVVHAAQQEQRNHSLKEFAEQCALLELRILVEYTLFVIMGFHK